MNDTGEKYESTIYNSVGLVRGLGYSGRRVKIVEGRCDYCGYDRLIQKEHVNPEAPPDVETFCNRPDCPEYHGGKLGIPRL
jgi:hypothetical protein